MPDKLFIVLAARLVSIPLYFFPFTLSSIKLKEQKGSTSSTPFCKNDRLLTTVRRFVHPVYWLDVAGAVYHISQ